MMAYVVLEDATGSIEMLAFSNTLNQYGNYLQENQVIVVQGKLSVRDEKEPQLMLNAVQPLANFEGGVPAPRREAPVIHGGKLYLKIPSEQDSAYRKVKASLGMFPGPSPAVLYLADTAMRRGTTCMIAEEMLEELRRLLGQASVVVK